MKDRRIVGETEDLSGHGGSKAPIQQVLVPSLAGPLYLLIGHVRGWGGVESEGTGYTEVRERLRGIRVIEPGDTTLEINRKSQGLFDHGALEALLGLYPAVRYSTAGVT